MLVSELRKSVDIIVEGGLMTLSERGSTMNELVATPDAIRVYGNTSLGIATSVATVGAFDQAAMIAAMVPVLGLIGQEVLISSVCAYANLASSTMELAGVHAATALTAHESAAAYEAAEAASIGELGAVNNT
ncbi:hypothetical protein ABTW96_24320 [Nocardia beijingensis]|uniref:hypothetical protein n=1 Tax=Nocardia beijingensis TaxID=95162 RepID=UPI003325FC8B